MALEDNVLDVAKTPLVGQVGGIDAIALRPPLLFLRADDYELVYMWLENLRV